ncbi:MAG TPA: outer membrane beta-barrel protein [Caulobacterales bacterium]|nr:outer membrane beta-barrel protein [Caulobacterales bacterium]
MLKRTLMTAIAFSGAAYAQAPSTPDAVSSPTPATAPDNTGDRVSYPAEFFAQFNPQNALDMINQVPGFALNGGDGRRGFSGSVGNVLVDGLRPVAKTQPINSILSHIPAAQVVRIEVLRGAAVSGDASGQAVLLNIVRTPTAGSGVYEVGLEFSGEDEHRGMPRADASYNGRRGQLEWGVGYRLQTQNRDLPGQRSFYDGAGNFTGRATITNPREIWDPYYNANIAFPLLGGRFSATGMINPDWFNEQENHYRFFDAADAPTGAFDTHWKEEGTLSEIGLNYDRNLGRWALGLVGLRTQHPTQYHEDALGADATTTERTIQHMNRETIETILRGSISRSLNPENRVEFGGEGAVNTLDSVFSLTVDDGSGPTPITIPNSNVNVEERRAEFFGVHTWRPNDRWSLETRVAWETSTLTFTGDANQEVELSYWKPSLQLARTFGGSNQLRLRIYRDVGQLNFDDFVSRTSISDDLINGGNPDLKPQTDWRTEFGGDLRFPGGAALGFALTYHRITDVNDLVPLTATVPNPNEDPGTPGDEFMDITFDAPGNIGDARAWSLDLNLSAPLGVVLPGARLTLEGHFWDTDVTDPVTGRQRIISWQPESEVSASFRQDFSKQRFSWGVEYFKQGEAQGYRLNEIDTQEEGPWVDLWVETTALPNHMKLRVWAANIGDGTVLRDRRFFDTDRNGPLTSYQLTDRNFRTSPWLTVELSGSF